MDYTYAYLKVQRKLMEALRKEFPEAFPWVVEAYTSGNFPFAAASTFFVDLVLGSFVYISVPSLAIPFGGISWVFFRKRT